MLFVAWAGLALNLFLGDVISDRFEYHKHGYEFCTLTMGTDLSMFSLQLLSNVDLISKLPQTGFWSAFAFISPDNPAKQHAFILGFFFLLACVASFATARISKSVNDPTTPCKGLLSGFNFALGSGAFGGYLLLFAHRVALMLFILTFVLLSFGLPLIAEVRSRGSDNIVTRNSQELVEIVEPQITRLQALAHEKAKGAGRQLVLLWILAAIARGC